MKRLIICLGLTLAPQLGWASEWTFKTVTPPASDATNRINIQITPTIVAAPPATASIAAPVLPSAPTGNLQPWFWDVIPPSRDHGQAGRFTEATIHVTNAPKGSGIAAPSLQLLAKIATDHGPALLMQSAGTRISPALALAVIAVESAGRTDAVSPAGAQGLMQLIPATAARFGVEDSKIGSQNIAGGVAYLDWLMQEFDGDVLLALAGYNAGEGAVREHDGVPPFAETRAYVPKVLAAWNVARNLCMTPPELPSDGCVFNFADLARGN